MSAAYLKQSVRSSVGSFLRGLSSATQRKTAGTEVPQTLAEQLIFTFDLQCLWMERISVCSRPGCWWASLWEKTNPVTARQATYSMRGTECAVETAISVAFHFDVFVLSVNFDPKAEQMPHAVN